MKFSASREAILKPLQAVIGAVERKQTMPVLSNVLLSVSDGHLSVTATDLEVELVAKASIDEGIDGAITVPGRKLHSIVRALTDGARVDVSLSGDHLIVKSGRSRFKLVTLPADGFPVVGDLAADERFEIDAEALKRLLDRTQFAMANQDVRYYLNGLMLETEGKQLRAVATNGHRLAITELTLDSAASEDKQRIVPRKGVVEMGRLLDGGQVEVRLGASHISVISEGSRMTSKLIEGRYPEYRRVIPSIPTNVVANRDELSQALKRVSILSNDKYRGVRLSLSENTVTVEATNQEQEEAAETVEIEYTGSPLEIGFHVNYLIDVLGAVESEQVRLGISDANSSCLIMGDDETTRFVVMPMRL